MRDAPRYALSVGKSNITTRFARDAEFAEMNYLFIAAETPAMKRQSAAYAAIGILISDDVIYYLA